MTGRAPGRRRSITTLMLAAALVAGCGGGEESRQDAGRQPQAASPEPTRVRPADTSKDGRFWNDLATDARERMAAFCKAQVAPTVSGSEALSAKIQAIDREKLVRALDDFYASSAKLDVAVKKACAELAPLQVQYVGIALDGFGKPTAGAFETTVRRSPFVVKGHMNPHGDTTRLRVERSRVAGKVPIGWDRPHRIALDDEGAFEHPLALTPGKNRFRLTGTSPGFKTTRVYVVITFNPPPG